MPCLYPPATYKCDLCGDVVFAYVFRESVDMGFCIPCDRGPKCLAVHAPSGDTCLQRVGHHNDHGQLFSSRWPKADLETANEVP